MRVQVHICPYKFIEAITRVSHGVDTIATAMTLIKYFYCVIFRFIYL